MKKTLVFALMSLFFVSGCATVGNRIESSQLSQIKKGVTTEAEVINVLGKPQMKTLNAEGKVMMVYNYAKVKNRAENFIPFVSVFSHTMDMDQQILTILLDKTGVVEEYTMNDSSQQIKSGLLNQ